MKNIILYIITLWVVMITNISCVRQKLEEPMHITALIPVSVNWDNSGITPTKTHDQNKVHRVSLRFFPKDGSTPFQLHLEGDVHSGNIEVPVGRYSVIAMNESITDVYWSDYYTFSDINDYDKIAATVVADNPKLYSFYKPTSGEKFMTEAHKLASWSMADFNVTQDMVTRTRAATTKSEKSEFTLNVEMRRLTHDIKVTATVTNLKSAQLMQGAIRGLSQKVYLASAMSEAVPTTQFFTLYMRTAIRGDKSIVENTFRSFGKLPETGDSYKYSMMIDVIFIDGSRYVPITPLEWDVTDKIDVEVDISIDIDIELPEVTGDIGVGDWEDDDIIIIQ